MGHGDQFGVAQVFAHRVPGYAQCDRDVLNGLSLAVKLRQGSKDE